MNEPRRARSASESGWDRARREYAALLGDDDPAAEWLAGGALDLRPGGPAPASYDGPVVVSGPADMREVRRIVEQSTGVGTWPSARAGAGPLARTTRQVARPAAVLGLLLAMEGLIEDRSPWRKWRTAVETLADRIAGLTVVTVEARLQDRGR